MYRTCWDGCEQQPNKEMEERKETLLVWLQLKVGDKDTWIALVEGKQQYCCWFEWHSTITNRNHGLLDHRLLGAARTIAGQVEHMYGTSHMCRQVLKCARVTGCLGIEHMVSPKENEYSSNTAFSEVQLKAWIMLFRIWWKVTEGTTGWEASNNPSEVELVQYRVS